MTAVLPAAELVAGVLDAGSFRAWEPPGPADPVGGDADYAAALAAARRATGLTESVLTGEGRLAGRRVAVAACEFGFLAGSIGVVAAERLAACVERATAERLPLIASPASGGTRLQEGTTAFVQMAAITVAVTGHRAAGLPYLVYLRHPTTGGVLASWGSLGHLTAAQPGALLGLLGPRVHEALQGAPFPAGVQRAENLFDHGLLDAVVAPDRLAELAARALRVLSDGGHPAAATAAPAAAPTEPPVPDAEPEREPPADPAAEPADTEEPARDAVRRSRRPDRPGVRELLRLAGADVTPLHGTGAGEHDPGLLVALARFGGVGCVVVGQDRRRQSADRPLAPAALRAARRGMRLAGELGLPLVTVVDTAGAALSRSAEEGGLAGEIAHCLADLLALASPTVCVLLGQGGGGAALALLPADRVLAARHAWLSPLPPEGAAAVLYRRADRAAETAARLGIRSVDLWHAGVVDAIVAERPDAADEPADFCRRMAGAVGRTLAELRSVDAGRRLADRRRRYRHGGR